MDCVDQVIVGNEDISGSGSEGMGQTFNMVNINDNISQSSSSISAAMACVNRGRSKVWNEFAVTGDGKKVTCRRCGDSLSYSNSHSTSSMLKHLKRKHNMDLYPPLFDDEGMEVKPLSKSQSKQHKKSAKTKRPVSNEAYQDDQPSNPSIQHDPLIFTDPCVRMRWADHSDTFLKTFSVMYNDESYTDCTLVAENQFFKGHRMILSSASALLDEMFRMTPAVHHPIIFLNNVKATELRILLDFIYKGEVSIPPSLIPGLVKVGGELKVKGLSDFIWNDQLASTIFQGYQSNNHHSQETVHLQQNSSSPSSACNYSCKPVVSDKPPIKLSVKSDISSDVTASYVVDKRGQCSGISPGPGRTYARYLSNIRSVNVPSQPQQNIGVSLGDGTALISQGDAGLKRMRIITTDCSPLSTTKPNALRTKFNSQSSIDSSMDCGSVPETVLMVTNQGQTVLSTSQGGVTLMTPNTISLPLNISMKDDNSPESHHQYHNDSLTGHPITILSTCGSDNAHELEEVVYSITEVPGGGHEVLMSGPHESRSMESENIVTYQTISTCRSVDKKS